MSQSSCIDNWLVAECCVLVVHTCVQVLLFHCIVNLPEPFSAWPPVAGEGLHRRRGEPQRGVSKRGTILLSLTRRLVNRRLHCVCRKKKRFLGRAPLRAPQASARGSVAAQCCLGPRLEVLAATSEIAKLRCKPLQAQPLEGFCRS